MQNLRAAILDMFSLASGCSDPGQFDALRRPIHETLLAALDAVLVTDSTRRARHRKLIARLDEQVDLRGSKPLYGDDLAQALGVSVRTLQTATTLVHGTSLHRYLRIRRLWSARRSRLSGGAGLTVKAAALGNGFWHMGDFSKGYKSMFGEMPSQTLAKGRGH